MQLKKTSASEEQGIALIVVLGLISLLSLMTVSIIAFSQSSYRLSKVTCDRARAAYWAEGAAARAVWMIRNDVSKHPSRTLGVEEGEADDGIERFLADGVEHTFKSYSEGIVKVSVFDAVSGIDISGSNPVKYLRKPQSYFDDDQEKFERYQLFINSVYDYVDSNDFIHTNGGFEKKDYNAENMAPLPRNYAMQYRDEILWIPGFEEFFSPGKYGTLSGIRIIAPRGLRQIRGRNNFFTANANQLKLNARLSNEQVTSVINARNAWFSDKTPLTESLTPDLLSKLKQRYSFRESGYYTFIINASPGEGLAGRILTCTLKINRNLSSTGDLRYYEWRFLR